VIGARIARVTLIIGLSVAAACGQTAAPTGTSTASAAPKTGGTLVVGANFSILSMDPARTVSATSMNVLHSTYDSLTTFEGADLKTAKPNLATSWTISPDGLTYAFALRSGAKFESGSPVTSTDVKWSLERLNNLKGISAFYVASIATVDAPDSTHVTIKLKAPNSGLLAILAAPPTGVLDSKLLADKGADASASAKDNDKGDAYLNGHSAGSGPYVMTTYTPNQQVVLERNANYWGTKPFFDRIVIQHQPEAATQKLQLERGDIQIAMGLGQDQASALQGTANVTVNTAPVATNFFVMFSMNPDLAGPLADPRVRDAIRFALDYDGIMKIAGSGAVRLGGVIPALLPGALDPSSAPKQDKDKAKQLLQQVGTPVKVKLSIGSDYVSGGVQFSVLGQKIQSDMQAVGIDVTIDGRPLAAWKADYIGGKLQMTVATYAADWPDPSNFLVFSPGGSVGVRAQWSANSSADAAAVLDLGQQAQAEVDATKRVAKYQQYDARLQQVGPYVPLFQPATPLAWRSDLKGVAFNTTWQVAYTSVSK
jgi:peptide/nickel transport system substrate-binding protein